MYAPEVRISKERLMFPRVGFEMCLFLWTFICEQVIPSSNRDKDSTSPVCFEKIVGNTDNRFYTCPSGKREINNQA